MASVMLVFSRRPLLALLTALAPAAACADAFDPLPTYNQNPLTQIYGLPAFDAPRLLPPGELQTRISFEAGSFFFMEQRDAETLTLDGEAHRSALTVKYATPGGEWGIEIPYLSHSGGFLDSFIEGWHEALGLPDGGREAAPRDLLRYIYTRNGTDLVRITDRTGGIGDVRLLAGWALPAADTADLSLRVSLKLPTGDAAQLHGSGAADLAAWLSAGCAAARCTGAWRWNAAAGALVLGRGDVLPEQQRRFAAFAGVGAGWRAWEPVVLKAELRAHSALYRGTELAPLGKTAMQLILGGTWIVNKETALDVAVSEDIRVHTAPDVSMLVSLRTSF